MRPALLLFAVSLSLAAEVRTMTLKQVLDTAISVNPEVVLARLDERKAADATRVSRDPFFPKIVAGSGLAYSSGYPMSIEGSAPSVVEARGIASIFNQPQRMLVKKAMEEQRASKFTADQKQEEVAYRASVLYLEAGRLAAALGSSRQQLENLGSVGTSTAARIAEGRELPIEGKRADLRLAQARQRLLRLETARTDAETQLAVLLGLPDTDQVRPADPEQTIQAQPANENEAVSSAIANSKELRRIESSIVAKGFEMKSYEAARYPKIDLVAQYGLFAKFNNYDKFFNRFQRNNGQLGVSFQLPIFPGIASKAQRDITTTEISRLRTQLSATRTRVAADARKAWREIAAAEASTEVARLDLEVAREQTSLLLTLSEEGRATQKQLEESRFLENEKWMALFDARYALDRARLDLLKETGMLLSGLR